MSRFRYSSEQLTFLRDGYKRMRIPELTEAFNRRFQSDKTEGQIRAALRNHKFRSGRACGFRKGERYLLFTQEQAEFIREQYPKLSRADLTDAFNLQFPDSPRQQKQIIAFVKNHKIYSGRTGYFKQGEKAWNSGTKGATSANRTSFKKGNVPANIRSLGAERVCLAEGYILVKVEEKNPYTGAASRFKHKHLVIWEEAHGAVPEGHVLRFKDGDKMNCTLENLELFSRGENSRLNRIGYNDAPEDVKPVLKTIVDIQGAAFDRRKELKA